MRFGVHLAKRGAFLWVSDQNRGAKIVKIGIGGGTGPYSKARPSLMDGLLRFTAL